MTKIKIAGVHPVAQLFPPMSDEEFDELVASITRDGQQMPIICDSKGMLLDGVNRSKACEIAGITPKIAIHRGDPVAFILAANVTRRHLNAGQCAVIVALAYPKPEKGGRGRKNLSKLETFSHSRLSEARKIIKFSRALALEVIAGTTTFQQALGNATEERIRIVTPFTTYSSTDQETVTLIPVVHIVTEDRDDIRPMRSKAFGGNVVNLGITPRPASFEDPETLAARVMARNKFESGYAKAVVNAILARMQATRIH